MKLYCISGLGSDQRVFKYLKLPYEMVPLDWIPPFKKETLREYALRLSGIIDTMVPFGIIGVSFGGMVAIEISKVLKPEKTILISSAQTENQLPAWYKFIGKLNIIPILPAFCFNLSPFLGVKLLGAQSKKLLTNILQDTDPKFVKWAIHAICTWYNNVVLQNILQIHGNKVLLLPLSKDMNVTIIEGGRHFMIVDKAEEISAFINKKL